MAKQRKSLIKPRSTAFKRQNGRCFYCNQPMWSGNPLEFASRHNITVDQAKRFMCTGEHLKAHKDGGRADQRNIVAACWYCNHNRHRRKNPPNPEQYKDLIQTRMSQGGWHNIRLS